MFRFELVSALNLDGHTSTIQLIFVALNGPGPLSSWSQSIRLAKAGTGDAIKPPHARSATIRKRFIDSPQFSGRQAVSQGLGFTSVGLDRIR